MSDEQQQEQKLNSIDSSNNQMQWSFLESETSDDRHSIFSTNRPTAIASNDHLPSLGLHIGVADKRESMQQQQPDFRLNEVGPAALASSIFQRNNIIVNSESEQSFVVLSRQSLESVKEASSADNMEVEKTVNSTDHSLKGSVMTALEMDCTSQKVLDENIKLREALKQNNAAITEQFNTITNWQKDVMSVCDNHKQKYLETKEMIAKLKKENNELKKTVEKNSLLDSSLTTAAGQLMDHSMNSFLEISNFSNVDNVLDMRDLVPNFEEKNKEPSINIPTSLNTKSVNDNDDSKVDVNQETIKNEQDLVKTIDILSKEMNTIQMNYLKVQEVMNTLISSNTSIHNSNNGSKVNMNQSSAEHKQEAVMKIDALSKELSNIKMNYSKIQEVINILTTPSTSTLDLNDSSKVSLNQVVVKNEQDIVKKIDTMFNEHSRIKINYSKIQEILHELEKRYLTNVDIFSQKLQNLTKELKVIEQKPDSFQTLELEKLVNKLCEKDNAIKYFQEIVLSLEQQMNKLEKNVFTSEPLQLEMPEFHSTEKNILKENVVLYNDQVSQLSKCFAEQCSHYLKIQNYLKESVDIIHSLEDSNMNGKTISMDKLEIYKNKLCENRKRLTDEQLQSIDAKVTIIKVQKLFHKILFNYNCAVDELEILRDENSKLSILQSKTVENYNLTLDSEKTQLNDEINKLQGEQFILQKEKEKLEVEKCSLSLEKENFTEEKASLVKTQILLGEQEKQLQAESKILQKSQTIWQKKCNDLESEIINLKEQLFISNNKRKENDDLIAIHKIQIEMYEKEFEEMNNTRKILQNQLQSLTMANLQLTFENDALTVEDSEQKQDETSTGSEDEN